MGLFYNNNVSGSGVSKNAPKKKPFFRFWEVFGNKFGTMFKINLTYFLFCIPIVTFGPATAALTALMRNIYLEKPQFVFHDFFKEFKRNFKKSLFIGLLDVAAVVGLFGVFAWYSGLDSPQGSDKAVTAVTIVTEVLFLLVNLYIYPQIAALELPLSSIVKNSFILMFVNLGGDLAALAVFVGYFSLALLFTPAAAIAFPFLPAAWLGLVVMFSCYPTIQRVLINPYYEKTGGKNPELPDNETAVFTDMGGKEDAIDLRSGKKGGKNIK